MQDRDSIIVDLLPPLDNQTKKNFYRCEGHQSPTSCTEHKVIVIIFTTKGSSAHHIDCKAEQIRREHHFTQYNQAKFFGQFPLTNFSDSQYSHAEDVQLVNKIIICHG